MTTFNLKKATKTQSRLRMAIFGPSGSGKTFSSLAIAKGLGGKIAVIDTERGSASKYADRFDFDVIELDTFAPQTYAEAIKYIESQGYDVIVIDSLTHAWSGKGGALEQVDNAAKRSQSNNTYTAWRDVTPKHNEMIDAIVGSKAHVIATMRSKTEYVLDTYTGKDGKTKQQPKKIGLAPIQRDGMEYEFDVVGEMSMENELFISKSRCEALTNGVFAKPNGKVSDMLKAWLTDGAPMVEKPAPTQQQPEAPATPQKQEPTARSLRDYIAKEHATLTVKQWHKLNEKAVEACKRTNVNWSDVEAHIVPAGVLSVIEIRTHTEALLTLAEQSVDKAVDSITEKLQPA